MDHSKLKYISVETIRVEADKGTRLEFVIREAAFLALQESTPVEFSWNDRGFCISPGRIVHLLDSDQKDGLTIDTG